MKTPRPVFLAGPPGSGKTVLGSRAAKKLGLQFVDLDDANEDDVTTAAGGIVALPWSAVENRRLLAAARKSGSLVGLWAHPDEMQARSGRTEPLFTSSARLKSAYGREGTACPEFRRLDRASTEVLMLRGVGLVDATRCLVEVIEEHREEDDPDATDAQRAGIATWGNDWADDGAARAAIDTLLNAMGRYLLHLEGAGTSARTAGAIASDLQAAGLLLFRYERPPADRVLAEFDGAPYTFEFERKFSSSPSLVARYERSVEGFARFLRLGR